MLQKNGCGWLGSSSTNGSCLQGNSSSGPNSCPSNPRGNLWYWTSRLNCGNYDYANVCRPDTTRAIILRFPVDGSVCNSTVSCQQLVWKINGITVPTSNITFQGGTVSVSNFVLDAGRTVADFSFEVTRAANNAWTALTRGVSIPQITLPQINIAPTFVPSTPYCNPYERGTKTDGRGNSYCCQGAPVAVPASPGACTPTNVPPTPTPQLVTDPCAGWNCGTGFHCEPAPATCVNGAGPNSGAPACAGWNCGSGRHCVAARCTPNAATGVPTRPAATGVQASPLPPAMTNTPTPPANINVNIVYTVNMVNCPVGTIWDTTSILYGVYGMVDGRDGRFYQDASLIDALPLYDQSALRRVYNNSYTKNFTRRIDWSNDVATRGNFMFVPSVLIRPSGRYITGPSVQTSWNALLNNRNVNLQMTFDCTANLRR